MDTALPESNFDIFRKLVDIEVDNRQRQAELKSQLTEVQAQQQTTESQHVTAMQILNTSRLQQAALQKQINENSIMNNESVALHQKTVSVRAEIGFMVASCSTQYKEMQALHEALAGTVQHAKADLIETEEAKKMIQHKLNDIIEQQRILDESVVQLRRVSDAILVRQSEVEAVEGRASERQETINAQINTIVEIVEDCRTQTAEATRLCRDHSIEHEEVQSEESSVDVYGPKLQDLQEKLDSLMTTVMESFEEIQEKEALLEQKQQEIGDKMITFEVERRNFLEDYRTMVSEFEASKELFFEQANKELEIQRQEYMDILVSFEKDKLDFLAEMKGELLAAQQVQLQQLKSDIASELQQQQLQSIQTARQSWFSSGSSVSSKSTADTSLARKDTSPQELSAIATAAGLPQSIYEGYVLKRADNSKMRLSNSWKKVRKVLFKLSLLISLVLFSVSVNCSDIYASLLKTFLTPKTQLTFSM